MARNDTRSRNRRVRVQETVGDAVALQPRTQLTAQARSGGADAAFALADALRGAGALQERRDREMAAQAQADFQRGETDEEQRNRSYRRTVEVLKSEARFVEDTREFDQMLKDLDRTDVSMEDINGLLDEFFAEKYGNLEDEHIAQALIPRMQEYRTNVLNDTIEIQEERETLEIAGALTTIFEAELERSIASEQPFNYDDLITRVTGILQPDQKGQANEMLFDLITDQAIRRGDVDLIRNFPSHRPDGSPTFQGDTRFNERVREAEARALAVAADKARLAQEEADELNEQRIIELQIAILDRRRRGEDVYDLERELISIPGFGFNDLSSARNFADSQLTEVESRSADLPYTAALWNQVHSGTAGSREVMFAYSNGLLGTGPQAVDTTQQMLSAVRSVRQQNRSNNNADITAARQAINNRYNAKTAGMLNAVNPVMHRLNIQANNMYNELIENGSDPWQAAQDVYNRLDPLVDRLDAIDPAEFERRSQSDFEANTMVTLEAMQAVLDGNASFNQMFGGVTDSVVNNRIVEELEAGTINTDQAALLLQQLY